MNAIFKASEICDKKVRRKALKELVSEKENAWKDKVRVVQKQLDVAKTTLKRAIENETQLETEIEHTRKRLDECLKNAPKKRNSSISAEPGKPKKRNNSISAEPDRNPKRFKNEEIGEFGELVGIYTGIANKKQYPLVRNKILLYFHPDKLPKEPILQKYQLFTCRVFHAMRVANPVRSERDLYTILEQNKQSMASNATGAKCNKTKQPPPPPPPQEEEEEEVHGTMRDIQRAYRDVLKNYAGPKMTAHDALLKRKPSVARNGDAKRKR